MEEGRRAKRRGQEGVGVKMRADWGGFRIERSRGISKDVWHKASIAEEDCGQRFSAWSNSHSCGEQACTRIRGNQEKYALKREGGGLKLAGVKKGRGPKKGDGSKWGYPQNASKPGGGLQLRRVVG